MALYGLLIWKRIFGFERVYLDLGKIRVKVCPKYLLAKMEEYGELILNMEFGLAMELMELGNKLMVD